MPPTTTETGAYLLVTPIRPRMVHFAQEPDVPEGLPWWRPREARTLCGVKRSDFQQAVWDLYMPNCERCMQKARGVKNPRVTGDRYIH